jgi:hypothetical protein
MHYQYIQLLTNKSVPARFWAEYLTHSYKKLNAMRTSEHLIDVYVVNLQLKDRNS